VVFGRFCSQVVLTTGEGREGRHHYSSVIKRSESRRQAFPVRQPLLANAEGKFQNGRDRSANWRVPRDTAMLGTGLSRIFDAPIPAWVPLPLNGTPVASPRCFGQAILVCCHSVTNTPIQPERTRYPWLQAVWLLSRQSSLGSTTSVGRVGQFSLSLFRWWTWRRCCS
jgi:hypothetical protein